MLTKIQILIVVAACAITATVTVCFVQWHQARQQADDAAAVRQAIYQTLKPPATVQDPGML
jgi:type II secretory pathway component PulL